jgi:hypothetical protein
MNQRRYLVGPTTSAHQTWNTLLLATRGSHSDVTEDSSFVGWDVFFFFCFESRNRPGVPQRVPGGLGSQISWHSAREGGEVVSLTHLQAFNHSTLHKFKNTAILLASGVTVSHTHRPPLPPGMFLAFIFSRGRVDPRPMVRSEEDTALKNPVTPPGIDPGTVRLVAKRLNHYASPGPVALYLWTNCPRRFKTIVFYILETSGTTRSNKKRFFPKQIHHSYLLAGN